MIDMELLNGDDKFRYSMLGRLQSDCEYYLNWGNRNLKRLWAGNVKDHITTMKLLYNSFKVKPEWLTMEQIKEYERVM